MRARNVRALLVPEPRDQVLDLDILDGDTKSCRLEVVVFFEHRLADQPVRLSFLPVLFFEDCLCADEHSYYDVPP